MKVWYLQNRSGRSGKFFFSESAYLKATHQEDKRKIFIFEMIDGGIESGNYSQSLFLNRERENQLSSIFNELDEFTVNYSKLKQMFEELCPEIKSFYTNKSEISKNFKIINDKKSFKSYISQPRIKKYLLLQVSDSIEWYEQLLKCHNFKSLPLEKLNSVKINNFEIAKQNVKKMKRT